MVPIVYGGADYSKILNHPKSYINVADYKTVKELADYIKYLDTNEEAYAEYYEWHRKYEIWNRQGYLGFSRMCYHFSAKPHEKKTYPNLCEFWNKGGCDKETAVVQPL